MASTINTSCWQSSAHNISSVYVGQSETYFTPKLASSLFPRFYAGLMHVLFAGAPFLSIAQMAAGLYTYPLFVSLLAIPILRERIGRWRLGALLVGSMWATFMLNPLASFLARSTFTGGRRFFMHATCLSCDIHAATRIP